MIERVRSCLASLVPATRLHFKDGAAVNHGGRIVNAVVNDGGGDDTMFGQGRQGLNRQAAVWLGLGDNEGEGPMRTSGKLHLCGPRPVDRGDLGGWG